MTNNNYRRIITRNEEWELSIISIRREEENFTYSSYGGEQGLFEIGLCHTPSGSHSQLEGYQVEVIEHHQDFDEVGVTINWFNNSSIEQIQERFNSYQQE